MSLGGCAGYAADYWKPKQNLIAAQLPRYGMAGTAGQCVEAALVKDLTVWQLRQLSDLAERLVPGGANPAVFGPSDFLHIASLVEDAEVLSKTRSALQGCGVANTGGGAPATTIATSTGTNTAMPSPSSATPTTPAGATPANTTPPAAASLPDAGTPLWVNLGAASTGQGIAVDASSVTRGGAWRQAWFRLLNSDQAGVGDIGYLLRIDCSARAITAHGGRKYAPEGQLIEQRDYQKPEGPMGIEPGTVMEVAYHALCDDPR
jgi:hypothetical protein